MTRAGMANAKPSVMEILKKVAAVPGNVIHKVADKVSATREHAREVVHRVIDRVEGLVGGSEHHLATAHASTEPARHIRKLRGHKKPRAERRKARRAAHAAS
jgi:hypothetical protein